MKRYILLLLIPVLTLMSASAQRVSLEVASQVAEGKNFTLTISMENIQGDMPSSPEIPNCRLIYANAMNSNVSSNGGATHSTTKVTFTYHAEKAGDVTIPKITINSSSGKSYFTPPRKLRILPAGTNISAVDRTSPASTIDDLPDGTKLNPDAAFSSDDMFVRVIMSKNTVYEQEPIVCTVKLFTRLNKATKFQMLTQPTFEGFLSEELEVTNPQGSETLGGKAYNTYIVKRCVLYPQKAGTLTITTGTYDITLEDHVVVNSGTFIPDMRILNKQVQTQDKSYTLKVLPLPQPQPASFNGAVGSFTATAELSSPHMRTNEPARYTIKIRGTGNIKYLKTPTLNLPKGFEQLTPKTDIDASYSDGDISGAYTVTYTLMPQKTGKYEIPPVEFTYFNPQSREYKTVTLKGYDVDVSQGDETDDVDAEVKKMTDINTIIPATDSPSHHLTRVYLTWWYWMLYVIAAGAFAGGVYYFRRRIRLNADVQGRRLARAMKVAMRRFRTARQMMDAGKADRFYQEITVALTGYLSDKLGIPASQLVRDNIAERLTAYGLQPDSVDNIINILDQCEMARFTPTGAEAGMAPLYDKVVSAVKSIEDVKQPKKTSQA